MQGIVFDRVRDGAVSEGWDGQFAIATLAGAGAEVTYTTALHPSDRQQKSGIRSRQMAALRIRSQVASSGEELAAAIAVRFTLAPGEKKLVPMALCWDFPIVQYGARTQMESPLHQFLQCLRKECLGHRPHRARRTSGLEPSDRRVAEAISLGRIQARMVSARNYSTSSTISPMAALSGATSSMGLRTRIIPAAEKSDSFSYMECFDYPYYSTLDVRFYGSWPLIKFWPEIEKQEMRQYSDTIPEVNDQRSVWGWKLERQHKFVAIQRKTAGAAPHDLGNPNEDPLVNINQYNWQDVTNWRDLNSKYVLMVWRDYVFSGSKDLDFLRYNYKSVREALDYLKQFDTDGDGLIENGGFPDQTYDEWPARGESAYCGSLYLAALRATAEMARVLGDNAAAQQYDDLFKKAQSAFIKKLWNGSYFNYDTGSAYKSSIMAEQLAGQWYANLTGLGALVPKDMRVKALQTVYDNNVMKFGGGQMGAINGIGADGEMLHDNEQVQEVWTGATFSIASEMISEGLTAQAYNTAKGVYNVVWDPQKGRGYWFRTPEAYDVRGYYRASMYMRPASIWSMEVTPGPQTEAGVPKNK